MRRALGIGLAMALAACSGSGKGTIERATVVKSVAELGTELTAPMPSTSSTEPTPIVAEELEPVELAQLEADLDTLLEELDRTLADLDEALSRDEGEF